MLLMKTNTNILQNKYQFSKIQNLNNLKNYYPQQQALNKLLNSILSHLTCLIYR